MTLEPGDVFGWSAVLDGISTASIVALDGARVLLFERGALLSAMAAVRSWRSSSTADCSMRSRAAWTRRACSHGTSTREAAPHGTVDHDLTSAFLPRSELDRLLGALRADGRKVIGPTIRDGAVVYTEIARVEELPIGWRADSEPGAYRLEQKGGDRAFDYGVGVTAWKRFTQPPRIP